MQPNLLRKARFCFRCLLFYENSRFHQSGLTQHQQDAFIYTKSMHTGMNACLAKRDPMDLTGEQIRAEARDLPCVQLQDSAGFEWCQVKLFEVQLVIQTLHYQSWRWASSLPSVNFQHHLSKILPRVNSKLTPNKRNEALWGFFSHATEQETPLRHRDISEFHVSHPFPIALSTPACQSKCLSLLDAWGTPSPPRTDSIMSLGCVYTPR